MDAKTGLVLGGRRADTVLTPHEWYTKVIGKLSGKYDVDSPNEVVRRRDERALEEELQFLDHLMQTGHIMFTLKLRRRYVNLARIISRQIKGSIIVEVPLKSPAAAQRQWRKDVDEAGDEAEDTWKAWNEFRMCAGFNPQIKLAIQLCEEVPSELEMQRWLGEPIEYIIVPSFLFIPNNNNYPVLPKKYQDIVGQFFQLTPNIMVKTNGGKWKAQLYSDYIAFLADRYIKPDIMAGYENLLETPLQPLYNNLDAYTYEVFERDPVKYKLYQDAIQQALQDKVPKEERKEKSVVIMILGR